MRYLPLLATSLFLTGCIDFDLGSSDRFQEDFHYSWDLQPNGRVIAEGFNGKIEVVGWDENKVDITGTKFGSTERLRDSIKIETHDSPGEVEVRAIRPSASRGNSGVRMTIRVPRQAVVDRVTSSNGSINVDKVGDVRHLKTSNGSIHVGNATGELDARTSNSSIDIDRFSGSVSLHTSNGRIRAEDLIGSCQAETSNGSINITMRESPTAPIRLETSNGSIDLALAQIPKGDVRAQSSNGSITVRLPANTSARLNADTSNSSITTEFEVASTFSGEKTKRDHLIGTIGSGGPTLDLQTRNGHIRILKSSGSGTI
jgi:DUF4097 and DUF4098 domain-containing protein YvlB